MKVLFESIYEKISGSDFSTSIGGRLYLHEAPQKATFPYTVYHLITNTPDDTFTESGEEFTLQFNIFSNKNSASEICDIYEDLKTCYDHTSLTVSGYNHVHTWRNFSYPMRDEKNNVWQYVCDFTIEIQKAR